MNVFHEEEDALTTTCRETSVNDSFSATPKPTSTSTETTR